MTEARREIPTRPQPVEPVRVTILHTGDMQGRLEAMARLSRLARRLRAQAEAEGLRVFLWDAGDACDPAVAFCHEENDTAVASVLNAMGYNLQTLGESMLSGGGAEAISDLCLRAEFPILAANVVDANGRMPEGLRASVRIPFSGRRTMGVLGLMTAGGEAAEAPGLRLLDPLEVAQNLVGRMLGQGVAPVVVLSHLGLNLDRQLVDAVAGIDLVVGGHSRDRLPAGETRGAAFLVHAGAHAEALGRVDLTVDGVSGRVLAHAAQLIQVPTDEPPDEAVLEAARPG